MNEDFKDVIIDRIRSHTPVPIGLDNARKSSVCIPLIKTGSCWDVLFEVRAETISGQPGDVCFPGGGIEPGESPSEAAVRECCEELLIDKTRISLIGPVDFVHSENFIVYPFAVVLSDYEGSFSPDEVGRVFRVPLDFFIKTEPERFRVDSLVRPEEKFPYERIRGGVNYQWRTRSSDQLFYEYDGTTIWGLTARIIHAFADMLRKSPAGS